MNSVGVPVTPAPQTTVHLAGHVRAVGARPAARWRIARRRGRGARRGLRVRRLVGLQQSLVHLPEAALRRRGVRRLRQERRLGMELLPREVPEGVAHLPAELPPCHVDEGRCPPGVGTGVIAVHHQGQRSIGAPEHVILWADGKGEPGMTGHADLRRGERRGRARNLGPDPDTPCDTQVTGVWRTAPGRSARRRTPSSSNASAARPAPVAQTPVHPACTQARVPTREPSAPPVK